MITIFSAPKAFEGHIATIQENAVRSWKALGPGVEILLVGDDPGIRQAAGKLSVEYSGAVARNERGTPLVSDIFRLAAEQADHELMCYVNADILLPASILPATAEVANRFERFLLLGQRWDIRVEHELAADTFARRDWEAELKAAAQPHPRTGSDYFVFRRGMLGDMPPFALGRAGWDNWMIFACRRAGIPVVDASQAVQVFHQDHDYAHLPHGQSHHKLPESLANVSMAGGRSTMFTLADTTWRLGATGLSRHTILHPNPTRALEAVIAIAVGPGKLAGATQMVFHPREAIRYLKYRLRGGRHSASMPMIESDSPDRSKPHEV